MSQAYPGRFNTPFVGAIYVSREPETAVEELRRRASRDGISLAEMHPRSIFVVDLELHEVVDFTAPGKLEAWGAHGIGSRQRRNVSLSGGRQRCIAPRRGSDSLGIRDRSGAKSSGIHQYSTSGFAGRDPSGVRSHSKGSWRTRARGAHLGCDTRPSKHRAAPIAWARVAPGSVSLQPSSLQMLAHGLSMCPTRFSAWPVAIDSRPRAGTRDERPIALVAYFGRLRVGSRQHLMWRARRMCTHARVQGREESLTLDTLSKR